MDNAAKAMLIAGGVLLSILIISLLLYAFAHARTIKQAEQEKIEIEQLQKFNQEFEVYNKKLLYGAEVLSVINKIENNNAKYVNDADFQMSCIVKYSQYGEEMSKEELASNFKTIVFRCNAIGYNSETGRVNYMEFFKFEK